MRRFLYHTYRVTFAINNWIMSRFTAGGLLVLGGAIASAVVGLDTNQTLAYQAFAFLLFLLIISLCWGMAFRVKITAKRNLPRFGTVNERLSYKIEIRNNSNKRLIGLLFQENLEDYLPTFDEFLKTDEPFEKSRNAFDRVLGYHRWLWVIRKKRKTKIKEHDCPAILPLSSREMGVDITPLRRGHLKLKGLDIASPDPFGLFKSIKKIPSSESVLILPKRHPLPPIHLPGGRRYQAGGVALASSVGESEEFLSMRDYRPGDPLRRIHWKSWAKTDKPIVKEYQDEFFVRHALILDTFQKEEFSDIFEEAVSVAASFAYSIQTQESLLDLMFVGTEAYCFTSGRGLAHTDKMLEILASVNACKDKPFKTLSPLVLERANLLSGCVCVLISWDEERKDFIKRLKSLGIPLLVLLVAENVQKAQEKRDLDPLIDDPKSFHILQMGKIKEGLARL